MKLRLFVFFALVFTLLTSREPPWADAHVTYDTTQALVDRWALDVHTEGGPPWFYAHHDHKKYGVFPLGNVVAMIPGYLAYKLAKHASFLPDKPLFAFCSHLSPTLLMAGVCTLFFALCRRRGVTARWSLFATLALGFTTFVFIYARAPYSEAVQTMVLIWVVERTLDQGGRIRPPPAWPGSRAPAVCSSTPSSSMCCSSRSSPRTSSRKRVAVASSARSGVDCRSRSWCSPSSSASRSGTTT